MDPINRHNFTPADIFPRADLVRLYKELADSYEDEQRYQDELFNAKMASIRYENRLKVPFGKDQKYYKWLLDDTKSVINEWKDIIRKNSRNFLAKATFAEYIDKEKRIKIAMKRNTKTEDNVVDIQKAKTYPMTQIVELTRANTMKCLWHEDKNPSMQYYPKTNSLYCFSCNKKADTIDVVMKKTGLPFIDAVRQLTS